MLEHSTSKKSPGLGGLCALGSGQYEMLRMIGPSASVPRRSLELVVARLVMLLRIATLGRGKFGQRGGGYGRCGQLRPINMGPFAPSAAGRGQAFLFGVFDQTAEIVRLPDLGQAQADRHAERFRGRASQACAAIACRARSAASRPSSRLTVGTRNAAANSFAPPGRADKGYVGQALNNV